MKEIACAAVLLALGFFIYSFSIFFTRLSMRDLTESIRRLRQCVEAFTDFEADTFSGKILADGSLRITFIKDLGQNLDGSEGHRGQQVCVTLPRNMWKAVSYPDGPHLVLGLQKDLEQEESE